MKVRAVRLTLAPERARQLGKSTGHSWHSHGVEVGEEYLVLGMSFYVDSPTMGSGIFVDLVVYDDYILAFPLDLFEIVDSRCSRYWRARTFQYGAVLWPEEFFNGAFHDKLSDDDPEVRAVFETVYRRLSEEFGPKSTTGDGTTSPHE